MGYLSKIEKKYINKINSYDFSKLSDEELKAKTPYFKQLLSSGKTLDDILPEAFAVVKEASTRILKMTPYDVQMIGGIVLHQGKIAELKTGEGKTLCAVAPAYLNALTDRPVHIVTVNDYLANRDATDLGPLYEFLGLSVGCILHDTAPAHRKQIYKKNIVYITNSELGFDYLRDNMVKNINQKVQPKDLYFCIIDEVDSILIDEARTPLIISGQTNEKTDLYKFADAFVKSLNKDDYEVNKQIKTVSLTESGIIKAEKTFSIDNFSDIKNTLIRHHIEQALKANYDMKIDKEYIIKDGKIVIIDEHTGRIADGRRYSKGLHQAIEAKEGVEIQGQSVTQASITYQNFFKLYKKYSGMTGTAATEKNEFKEIYKLDVVVVPTNKPVIRKDNNDLIYVNQKAKNLAIIKDIKECYKTGRPVLVGTLDIRKSEKLSKLLTEEGIPHQLLNAKQDKTEADIIAKAGEKGAVTIATNIAGRGTDIKLTEETKALGGLKIIATERAVDRRIDNQLIGRSGRQGDPGESQFYLSFDDELLVYITDSRNKKLQTLNDDDFEPVSGKFFTNIINNCQKKIESQHFDSRKDTIKYDKILNNQRINLYAQRDYVLSNNCIELIHNMISSVVETECKSIQNIKDYAKNRYNIEIKSETKNDIILELNKAYDEFIGYFNEPNLLINNLILTVVDFNWIKYLEDIEELKQDIKLLSYRGEDPVRTYNEKASKMFKDMNYNIKKTIVDNIFKNRIELQKTITNVQNQPTSVPQDLEELKKIQKI